MDGIESRREWARMIDELDRELEDPAYAGELEPRRPPVDFPERVGRGARTCRLTEWECSYLDRMEGR